MFVAVVRYCSFNFSHRISIFKVKYKVTDHEAMQVRVWSRNWSFNFPHFTADLHAKSSHGHRWSIFCEQFKHFEHFTRWWFSLLCFFSLHFSIPAAVTWATVYRGLVWFNLPVILYGKLLFRRWENHLVSMNSPARNTSTAIVKDLVRSQVAPVVFHPLSTA